MKKLCTYTLSILLSLPCLCSCLDKPATLKSALADKFLIGTALNVSQITGRDTAGIRVVEEQFSTIVAENCMKSGELFAAPGEYDFTMADKFVEFGTSRGIAVSGHTLIWHSQLPKWFCHDEKGELVTPDVLKERMKNHIYTVVGRYKGRIFGWDVVNEAINDNGTWRESPFYKILGEEFMYLAFQYANEADPNVELYYNDYNEWHTGKRDAIVKVVKELKKRGLRIDGVGMQGHVGLDGPSLEEYQAAIDAYASAGVKVMITEFDMSALPFGRRNVGANIADTEAYNKEMNPYTNGLPEDISTQWNTRMMDFFRLFLKNSDKISRVTVWGVADGDSWKNNFPMPGRTDYPLLFDRNHQPKPVVGSIIDAAMNK
ncbi:endo-1,4-beta-xylanase [Bacteroides sp. 51]|uniref:endo-1,4-beta-xylanase n=1 Tax=Bacteroides sp. 51 TaxID=2302938 RepID=UPI0013D576F8|nr:endo-1,4-beta-xylanase [Bacteroides sp. 51]NDV81574.1 endo-1,4-beta-xylanase [Bacteroides sp. 51]